MGKTLLAFRTAMKQPKRLTFDHDFMARYSSRCTYITIYSGKSHVPTIVPPATVSNCAPARNSSVKSSQSVVVRIA